MIPIAPLLATADTFWKSQSMPAILVWVAPFVLLLLSIAILPLFAHHFWESNRNKALVALVLGLPATAMLLLRYDHGLHALGETTLEYAAFIVLLAALYVISGGIYVRGSFPGTPLVNTVFLAIGAVIASLIGTTGASMVLIRPILRANKSRQRKAHIVIFFIFIVSNMGGLLTPLGDPPLFLGFLRGVPFEWTLALWRQWLFMCVALLVIFNLFDQYVLNREERERKGAQYEDVQKVKEPLSIEGKANLLLLLGVVAVIFCVGRFGKTIDWLKNEHLQKAVQIAGMLALAVVSMLVTARAVREGNAFTWGPIVEVAVLFAGIFVTMVPALKILEAQGGQMGITKPWQFFWMTGMLSSFLDNAPTYLTYTSVASGLLGTSAQDLSQLLKVAGGQGAALLAAISCGAVFMGANTYIGNGPNFMVKAIAEEGKVKMPSFLGYMLWSGAILVPLYIVVTLIFFRG